VVTLEAKTIQRESNRRGWSQQELARRSGLSRPTISLAWRGGLVSGRTAQRLMAAFKRYPPTLDGFIKEAAS